jgi:perosamine synthetase
MRPPLERIPVSGPSITDLEVSYVAEAARTAWYSNANAFNDRFERAFAEYIGIPFSVALPSCTSAIHLSLLALGIGPGDEVVVPDCTWIASAAPISYVGATPVFADIDARGWCLSPAAFEAAITPRTRAVIPVNLYGGMADYDAINQIAAQHGIAVVEDAAESIGSRLHGRPSGSFGTTGVFSFHGSKTLTTGEGGMLVTSDRSLHERVLVLRDHGRKPGDRFFFNSEVGWKYKMSAMQAALGLAQLERIDELVERKRRVFSWYRERLADIDGLQLNHEPDSVLNTYWMVTAILPAAAGGKSLAMDALAAAGIDSRPFFHPLSSIPAYADSEGARSAAGRNATAYRIAAHGINLPSGLGLSEDDVDRVCSVVRSLVQRA